MKIRLLIIIAIVIFSSYIFFSLYSFDESRPFEIPKLQCGKKYIQRGAECHLDPTLIDKNTIIIYDVTDNSGTRMTIAPWSLVINLEENDTVTWVNKGAFTVSVRDFTKEQYGAEYAKNVINKDQHSWKTAEFGPQLQESIQFNNTDIYFYRIDAANDVEMGDIVVLSKETNSLPVHIKAKMAQSIITSNFDILPELVSVGSGGAPGTGVSIGILESELEKHDDAQSYYYEYFKNMIPFDVPITIEFHGPITFD
ncbi:hypothetical protein [Nitrosopumilus ureiphilus]|uniref:Uncharacterized protein n=1 Tax=Nitrosopumilus ureiphilus TaxID=1470067 RepID=A0A7D5RD90_9ARCH|nr:hypothetical protein [Nitrosopumilus ureiphilus]QLH06501.1 hypothetical protein C5F50_05005 [Nitrosopumilus ureiphilus]